MESYCLMGIEFQFHNKKKFLISVILSWPKGLFKFFCNGQIVWLTHYNNMNILNVITVYT